MLHAAISDHRNEIRALCLALGVRRLDVFGSATTAAFDESHSDVDLVVEFADPTSPGYVDAYFTLKERLEALFGRPVDLVTRTSIENPYFRRQVEATAELLYAA